MKKDMTTTQLTSFVKQFVAIIKGDDAEAQAQKEYRRALSALKTQIASLEGDTITFQDKLEEANNNFDSAKVNHGQSITDRNKYVQALLLAKKEVIDAQENLDAHNEKLEVLRQVFDEIQTEVVS